MKLTVSRDRNNMLCGGRHYVFTPHEKPRCRFCAFLGPHDMCLCGAITSDMYWVTFCSRNRGRADDLVGYWKETQ
jgi:hypothetical protein